MSLQIFAVILRMIERSLIVTGGILAIYLGYKLFTLGIDKTQGEASAFGVSLRNFGPGLFFAALMVIWNHNKRSLLSHLLAMYMTVRQRPYQTATAGFPG